ncbi:thermonuclease family protein [Brucella pseudintermedia]|uniref:Thermonuclease family protein n=1 Tax=Brucella pseudintermedia TaxID=370111 RepID=A0ABY5U7B4_9HYPH|nr:thermonuclease family protein [Brucella pseudintermedia]UWL59243.1 thermonuclease family protein [Brucella pseudintermedia]
MKIRIVLLAALAISTTASAGDLADLTGRASVIDGDTIEIQGQRIRLNGIDAPESWQTCKDAAGKTYRCGKDAAFALADFLDASQPISCLAVSMDRYRRTVADCFRSDREPVNAWMVREGWAVDWVKYSGGAYEREQDAAQSAQRGIWQGDFQMPCEARAARSKRAPSC